MWVSRHHAAGSWSSHRRWWVGSGDWMRNRELKSDEPVGAEPPMVATAGNAL
ncbi:hypothetical protein RBSWK_00804 [Rhodopirellula baltica SWK14]|uniref:Uncharacterized protein n=1 Tax=Rhodopirellula baltica SWK14 TaxID=993516 RepID=L7CMP6_RHOBT|nr:hypothetical protein RBSWK_00804 [Rhodopirellula baltica SWK14]